MIKYIYDKNIIQINRYIYILSTYVMAACLTVDRPRIYLRKIRWVRGAWVSWWWRVSVCPCVCMCVMVVACVCMCVGSFVGDHVID